MAGVAWSLSEDRTAPPIRQRYLGQPQSSDLARRRPAKGPGTFLASLPDLWRLAVERATFLVPARSAIGFGFLLRWRRAFALTCIGLMVMGAYVWANYLRLEHYLLVPWLILAIGMRVEREVLGRGPRHATRARPRAGSRRPVRAADFPRVSAILARDGYFPRQFAFRGEHLAFNSGEVVLAVASMVLVTITNSGPPLSSDSSTRTERAAGHT